MRFIGDYAFLVEFAAGLAFRKVGGKHIVSAQDVVSDIELRPPHPPQPDLCEQISYCPRTKS